MIIHPEVIVTPDCPTVKFRETMDQVNLDLELPKILHTQGWDVGTYFHVQFVSYDKTKLVASGLFVVTSGYESIHTANPDSDHPNTKSILVRLADQIGDWFYPGVKVMHDIQTPSRKVRWNFGRKVYEVMEGDKVVYENADKTEAQKVAEAA